MIQGDVVRHADDNMRTLKVAMSNVINAELTTFDTIQAMKKMVEEYKMWADVKNIMSKK
jgi:hypothetical protein